MKTYKLEPDGSLTVLDDNGTRFSITRANIAAHRRDPEFEAALQASADLTAAQKAALPAPAK